jgi:hypothetical protein
MGRYEVMEFSGPEREAGSLYSAMKHAEYPFLSSHPVSAGRHTCADTTPV